MLRNHSIDDWEGERERERERAEGCQEPSHDTGTTAQDLCNDSVFCRNSSDGHFLDTAGINTFLNPHVAIHAE